MAKKNNINNTEEKVEIVTKAIKRGMIFSRLDHVVNISYKGETLVVSPGAKLQVKDFDKIDTSKLPKGVTVRAID